MEQSKSSSTPDLAFSTLRRANTARLPLFKNAQGKPAHEKADGSDWSLLEWAGAAGGELGEAQNIAKKMRRGDFRPGDQMEAARERLAEEIADTIIYLDILAKCAGIDLAAAVRYKWDKTSRAVGYCAALDNHEEPKGRIISTMPPAGARDWPEDWSSENGRYIGKCSMCGHEFYGHKRRVICRECMESPDNACAAAPRSTAEGDHGPAATRKADGSAVAGAPVIDERITRYHVRERDNRVAIVVSQPGWAIKGKQDYWYVHIEDLTDGKWVYRQGSSDRGYQRLDANKRVLELYAREAQAASMEASFRAQAHPHLDPSRL